jgi:predicted dehydrogenase
MTTNYGLIGCGGAGTNRHLPAVRANPRTSLRAVCDLDEERVASVADDYDVTSYTDAEAMIEREELDAVSVATPPATHRDILGDIMETGVDILVEKPFATTAEDAQEILGRVGPDQTVTEVNNQLFKPVVWRASEAVDRGVVGTVRQVYTHSSLPELEHFLESHPDWITSLPGSVFGENLPHWIYLTRRFMGAIEDVDVQTFESGMHSEIDSNEVVAQLRGEDANGEIRMVVEATSSNFLLVVGDDGSLVVDLDNRVNHAMASTSSAIDVLRNNVENSADIARQTVERAINHGLTIGLRKWGSKDNVMMADKAYETDGHYQQISEVASSGGDNLTVKQVDMLNNARTYESIVAQIESRE